MAAGLKKPPLAEGRAARLVERAAKNKERLERKKAKLQRALDEL